MHHAAMDDSDGPGRGGGGVRASGDGSSTAKGGGWWAEGEPAGGGGGGEGGFDPGQDGGAVFQRGGVFRAFRARGGELEDGTAVQDAADQRHPQIADPGRHGRR